MKVGSKERGKNTRVRVGSKEGRGLEEGATCPFDCLVGIETGVI